MHGIYLTFEVIYDVFLTYCDMIELIYIYIYLNAFT